MSKRYIVHFASEHIKEVLTDVNEYLAAIENKENPIVDVQIADIDYHGAYYHFFLLITEHD